MDGNTEDRDVSNVDYAVNVTLGVFALFILFLGISNMRSLRAKRRFRKNKILLAFYLSAQTTVLCKINYVCNV